MGTSLHIKTLPTIELYSFFPADKIEYVEFVKENQESNLDYRYGCKDILPLLEKVNNITY